MLYQIDDRGRCYQVKDLPFRQTYDTWLAKFSAANISTDEIKSYMAENLAGLSKFSVATNFGGSWEGTPIQSVYTVCRNNPEQAAMLLGRIIMDVLIYAEEEWLCTKTNLQERDFTTNFYWRKKTS